MVALKKWLDQTAKMSGPASERALYVTEEVTGVNQYEEPAAADLIILSDDANPQQAAELVSINSRAPGSRAPQSKILGPTDHGTVTVKFPWRPPSTAAGSDVPMGHKAITGFFGTKRIVNGQAAEAIVSVVSHSRTATVLRVAAAVADYNLGDIMGLRIGAAAGTPGAYGNGDAAAITKIDDTPGSGNIDLTLEPGFIVRPTTSDFIRGLNSWIPDEEWQKRWSITCLDGFDWWALIGSVFNTLKLAFSRRDVFELEFGAEFRNRITAAEDQVRGDASTDAFTASDTALRVGDAKRFVIPYTGGYPKVYLRKMVVATGLQSGSDEAVQIIGINTSTGVITLAPRSGTGVSATDLTAVTSSQEVAQTYDTSTKTKLDINIDNRGWLTVTLTASATLTAATAVADIQAALAASPLYGHYGDAHPGFDIDWAQAASAVSSKVRLSSQLWGSQSRIQVRAHAVASLSAHDVIFTGAFDLKATDEVQIIPWTPGGTESRTAIHGREGVSKINGHILETTECTIDHGNNAEWMEDVRHLDPIGPAGVTAGVEREATVGVKVDARGWTARLQKMAEGQETASFIFMVGGDALGSGFAVFAKASRFGTPSVSKSGARGYKDLQLMPQAWVGTRVVSAVTTEYAMPELVAGNY